MATSKNDTKEDITIKQQEKKENIESIKFKLNKTEKKLKDAQM